jgi:hypothetical protein
MADWRQIQARIRKAKNSPDAPEKLSELFQRTRDAMVAWELGAIEEKAARNDEAVKWYTIAAQRFRRSDWKKKAADALARLGVELPVAPAEASSEAHTTPAFSAGEVASETAPLSAPEEPRTEQVSDGAGEEADEHALAPAAAPSDDGTKKKRRRGRRGGRGRRRKGAAVAPGLPKQSFVAPAETHSQLHPPHPRAVDSKPATIERSHSPEREQPRATRAELPAPQLPSERTAHGRAGDPALASRMAHLESMLRRLLGSALRRLDEVDEAPAGPGVFLLSDSDQTAYYYIEACHTLRVGLGNLARGGGRSSKGSRPVRGFQETGLKARLAEHLGISEAKVSQYLKDHCVVRWIQLDDDAPHLAHFAIGILRTPLNVD